MNSVILMGRLTMDPQAGNSQNSNYCRFNVAVDRRLSQEQRNNPSAVTADFPSCVAWGKTADFITKYFHKGMRICVEGRIQTGKYNDKDGRTVYTTDVVVNNAEFCESKGGGGNGGNGGGGYQQQQSAPPQTDSDGFMKVDDDGELPFN